MDFLEKTFAKIGVKLLQYGSRNRQRSVKATNLHQAATVGILFNAGKVENQKLIKEFIKSFSHQQISFTVIGYIPNSSKDFNYIGDKTWHFFSKKECTLFYHPKQQNIIDFTEKTLDILMVLDTTYQLPLHWITKMSKAKFKTGLSGIYDEDLDFMIDLKEKSTSELIEQLKRYLEILNVVEV
jgi:hypothetical protein